MKMSINLKEDLERLELYVVDKIINEEFESAAYDGGDKINFIVDGVVLTLYVSTFSCFFTIGDNSTLCPKFKSKEVRDLAISVAKKVILEQENITKINKIKELEEELLKLKS